MFGTGIEGSPLLSLVNVGIKVSGGGPFLPQLLGDHDLVLGGLVEFRSNRVAELVGCEGVAEGGRILANHFLNGIGRHPPAFLVVAG